MKTVVLIGATPQPDSYAFKAMQKLQEQGYKVIPVNPEFTRILGERCYPSIADVPGPIDTVTLYLRPARSYPLFDDILKAKPRRIIFNPGAENHGLARATLLAGIEAVNKCTLMMLGTGMF